MGKNVQKISALLLAIALAALCACAPGQPQAPAGSQSPSQPEPSSASQPDLDPDLAAVAAERKAIDLYRARQRHPQAELAAVIALLGTAVLSVGLGLFNLVPIPPLDGSKVLFALLPERAYLTLMRYERYGMLVLLLLVWLDVGGSYLSGAIGAVCQWMIGLFF